MYLLAGSKANPMDGYRPLAAVLQRTASVCSYCACHMRSCAKIERYDETSDSAVLARCYDIGVPQVLVAFLS